MATVTLNTTLTAEQVDALVAEAGCGSIFVPPSNRSPWRGIASCDGLVLVTADGVTYIGEIDDTPDPTDGTPEFLVTLT
jgi:hypothetical protein